MRKQHSIPVVILLFFSGIFSGSFAQEVEHNYPVGPSKTSCDSLLLDGLPFEEAVEKIENTTFRFNQKFSYSRLSGVQKGQYYSCDGKNGLLLLTVDKINTIYKDVPKPVWDSLINSSDPDSFFNEKIRPEYAQISEE
jgi:hypothetical protein